MYKFTNEYRFVEFNRINKRISKEMVEKNSKTVLFTSASDAEGKTFMVINIALNFIHNTPLRLLILDMNLRNPQIHKYFNLPKTDGISDILNNGTHYKNTIKKSAKYPNLHIISSGSYDGIATQSFSKLQNLIDNVKLQFDLIIIESSPCLISNRLNIDPAILSSTIDLVFFVVLARKTRKVSLIKSQELINLAGGKIDGVVLNNKHVKQHTNNIAQT